MKKLYNNAKTYLLSVKYNIQDTVYKNFRRSHNRCRLNCWMSCRLLLVGILLKVLPKYWIPVFHNKGCPRTKTQNRFFWDRFCIIINCFFLFSEYYDNIKIFKKLHITIVLFITNCVLRILHVIIIIIIFFLVCCFSGKLRAQK